MRKEIKIGIIVGVIVTVSAIIFFIKSGKDPVAQTPDTSMFSSSSTSTPASSTTTPAIVKTTTPAVVNTSTSGSQTTTAGQTNTTTSTTTTTPSQAVVTIPLPTTINPANTSTTTTSPTTSGTNLTTTASASTTTTTLPSIKPTTNSSLPTVYQQQMNEQQFHVVKKGDSLSSISVKYYGSSKYWQAIYNSNKNVITNASSLKIGWKLRIPSPEELE